MFSDRFPPDLLEEIIPLVQRNYRVFADADDRAIAGLSMGGGQALSIGLSNLDRFHYVLGFSAAVGGQFISAEPILKNALLSTATTNKRLRLLWISCGRQDFLYEANRQFSQTLTSNGIKVLYRETEGAHVWSVWRNNLVEALPLLFVGRQR